MVRTRGRTNVAPIDDGPSDGCRHPPNSSRYRKGPAKHAPIVEEDNMQDDNVEDNEPKHFPGGPYDLSVIRSFEDHVALRLWSGEDRGPLAVVAHGLKLRDFGKSELPQEVQHFVDASGLSSLVNCSFSTIDRALISAFAERWYRDTSSFHLPVGEMSITLDDVACLLHIPIQGDFFTFPVVNNDTSIGIVLQLLGVSYHIAYMECSKNRGPHLSLRWLRELYKKKCDEKEWEFAARAFLLHLVGCTIFTNKSQSLIDIKYLEMFRDLRDCKKWAWGAAALAVLYENLGDASLHQIRQIAGYLTLVQAWIYEHFPNICERTCIEGYNEQFCRALRWRPRKGDGKIEPFRRRLDDFKCDDVVWNPYKSHRIYSGFDATSLFSGYIRFGTYMVPHLPERVVRQFGHVQFIPRPPQEVTGAVLSPSDVDNMWLRYYEYLINIPMRGPLESDETTCVEGYMEWYKEISHPFITKPPDPVQSLPTDDEGQIWKERCQRVAELLQMTISEKQSSSSSELLDIVKHALRIVQGESDESGRDVQGENDESGSVSEVPGQKRKNHKTNST